MHPAEIDILLTGSVVEHRSSALGHYAGKNLLQSKKKTKKAHTVPAQEGLHAKHIIQLKKTYFLSQQLNQL